MDDSLQIIPYVIPAVVAIFTTPTVWRFARSIYHVKGADHERIYEDKDGVASEESMAKYSTKYASFVIFLGIALGLAASFSFAVFATVSPSVVDDVTNLWLLFWCWVFVLVQAVDNFRDIRIISRYQNGIISSVSLFLVAICSGALLYEEIPESRGRVAFIVALSIQVCSALAAGLPFLFIPRRPDVFDSKGKVVERQFQSSLWTRYSYNWSSDILDLAATKLIELSDLPAMDSHVRAKDAKLHFQSIVTQPSVSLWRQIFWVFRWQLIFQWLMVILCAIIDAGPQLAVLKILQYLEARQEHGAIDPKAWLCVGFLFLTTMAETIFDYRVGWLMWSDLGVPIRSTLTALIFEKMMKVKDCKEPPKNPSDAEKTDDNGKSAAPEAPKDDISKKDAAKAKKRC
ncbi:hypothetical protein G7Y89_g12519 [Cudoniella acicularis]|uniref:Uncharacterized protein n=1 Tax=Cudoniella acicularis TaxID=354080 RepID=A0A8H4VZ35_9HELO|nr:hypothetical protein G7Y89_g12519 [Cudoniella acicularis]